jgi:glycosyltransferase involved in cell wall biosynthesis
VVASTAGEIPRNVRDGNAGFVADPEDIETYLDAIETLFNDTKSRCRFGESGRHRVAEQYSQNVLIERFLDVISETYFDDSESGLSSIAE